MSSEPISLLYSTLKSSVYGDPNCGYGGEPEELELEKTIIALGSTVPHVVFDYGLISSILYGSVSLEGRINLVGQGYSYPALRHLDATRTKLIQSLDQSNLLTPTNRDKRAAVVNITTSMIALADPLTDMLTERMEFNNHFHCLFFVIDDYLDTPFYGFQGKNQETQAILEAIFQAISGKPIDIKNAGMASFPFAIELIDFAHRCHKLAVKAIPNFEFREQPLLADLKKSLNCQSTLLDIGLKPNISEDLYKGFRRFNCGAHCTLELLALIHDIDLPQKVRESGLFAMLKDAAVGHIAYTNDILGLPKDLAELDENSVVIFKCRVKGSLEAALKDTIELSNRLGHDIPYLEDKLREMFGPCPEMEAYFNMLENWVNGHILWYELNNCRYQQKGTFRLNNADWITQTENYAKRKDFITQSGF